MPPPTTQIAAAQDGLLSLLQASPALQAAGVPIGLGWPWTTPQASYVWIEGDVPVWTVERLTTGSGPRARWERFILRVRCVALHSSSDYVATRNQALVYVGAVDVAVRSDRTLAGSVAEAEVVGGTVAEVKDDTGRGLGVMFTLNVECEAPLNG